MNRSRYRNDENIGAHRTGRLAFALAASCFVTLPTPAQPRPGTDGATVGSAAGTAPIDDVHEAYEQGRWHAAYAGYAALADQGDPEAARIAWLMHRHGTTLYRTAFPVSEAQRLRWQLASGAVLPASLQPPSRLATTGAMADARELPRRPADAAPVQPRR